ncbi:MAG TPA: hypothetical protein VIM11_19390 [Tepidisphaeraceae bacterium]|jgi:hypothetical protein
MSRILVHYDIDDDGVRDSFQKSITDPKVNPQFKQVTYSVYEAQINVTDANLQLVRSRLLAALPAKPPKGTKVVLEHPTTTNNAPDIVPSVIANA